MGVGFLHWHGMSSKIDKSKDKGCGFHEPSSTFRETVSYEIPGAHGAEIGDHGSAGAWLRWPSRAGVPWWCQSQSWFELQWGHCLDCSVLEKQ